MRVSNAKSSLFSLPSSLFQIAGGRTKTLELSDSSPIDALGAEFSAFSLPFFLFRNVGNRREERRRKREKRKLSFGITHD
jgi:hypothetical protein